MLLFWSHRHTGFLLRLCGLPPAGSLQDSWAKGSKFCWWNLVDTFAGLLLKCLNKSLYLGARHCWRVEGMDGKGGKSSGGRFFIFVWHLAEMFHSISKRMFVIVLNFFSSGGWVFFCFFSSFFLGGRFYLRHIMTILSHTVCTTGAPLLLLRS